MLKDNEKNFSRLHMLIDAVVLALSYFLAWLIRFVGPMSATAVRTRSFQEKITYILFEEGSEFEQKECQEALISQTFEKVYETEDRRIRIYKTIDDE